MAGYRNMTEQDYMDRGLISLDAKSHGKSQLRFSASGKQARSAAESRFFSPDEQDGQGAMTRMNQQAGSPSAGMQAPKGSGAKISPNSFSAGKPEWAGRVAADTNAPGSSQADFSVRDMFKPGSGSTNGLSLMQSGSLFDSSRFARNREVEIGPSKAAKPEAAKLGRPVEGPYTMPQLTPPTQYDKNTGNSPDFGFAEEESADSRAYDEQLYGKQSAAYGGDVSDPREFMSMALRDGLGDEKLIQAAMKGGDTDLSKRYKNLSRMGVV